VAKKIACIGCGARVAEGEGPAHKYIGASPGCWALYGEVLAREYTDPRYGAAHQLTVDAYAAQHPGTPSPQSIQSVTVHLVGLYVVFELGRSPQQARKTIQRAVQHKKDFIWLDPPTPLGKITIIDIHKAKDHSEHNALVREWAMSVWRAWEPHHPMIRRWA
jgi:hypothetical protein